MDVFKLINYLIILMLVISFLLFLYHGYWIHKRKIKKKQKKEAR